MQATRDPLSADLPGSPSGQRRLGGLAIRSPAAPPAPRQPPHPLRLRADLLSTASGTGPTAAGLAGHLEAEEGLAFINITPRDELGVVDTKLKTIEAKQLDGQLAQLGLQPLLTHLRDVHAQYGGAEPAEGAPAPGTEGAAGG